MPATNDTITIDYSVNKYVIIYAGDYHHPSRDGSPYYYKFSDESVLSTNGNYKKYSIDVIGMGSCTVEIWNEQTNKMVSSVNVKVINSDLDDVHIFINGIAERYDGEIKPNAQMQVVGIEKPESIKVYVEDDIVNVEYHKQAELDYMICLPSGYIWNPNKEVIVKYNGFEIARYYVDCLYNGQHEGAKFASDSVDSTLIVYRFTVTANRNYIASIASNKKYRNVYASTYNLVNDEYQPVKDAVAVDNAYSDKISVYGLSKSGAVYVAIEYPANSTYPRLKTEFIEYPTKLEGTSSLTDAKGNTLCEVEFYMEDK